MRALSRRPDRPALLRATADPGSDVLPGGSFVVTPGIGSRCGRGYLIIRYEILNDLSRIARLRLTLVSRAWYHSWCVSCSLLVRVAHAFMHRRNASLRNVDADQPSSGLRSLSGTSARHAAGRAG